MNLSIHYADEGGAIRWSDGASTVTVATFDEYGSVTLEPELRGPGGGALGIVLEQMLTLAGDALVRLRF
jgi:hypothetical protein